MKQIEGQILLSIHQYFPIDCIGMAKKSEGMMNLLIESISDKVRKGIMDCDLDFSSLEISNQAKPLFTLTAEEVEKEEQILGAALLKYVELYHANKQTSTANDWKESIDYCHQRLAHIKEWQDEQANKNRKS